MTRTKQEAVLAEILEDKITYGETFFVPKRARWNEEFTGSLPLLHCFLHSKLFRCHFLFSAGQCRFSAPPWL